MRVPRALEACRSLEAPRGSSGIPCRVILPPCQVAVSLIFILAGGATVLGAPMMLATFDEIGFGHWFRYATGSIQVASAIGLLIPSWTRVAAFLLALTMIGAVDAHLYLIGGSPAPAALLVVANLAIAWNDRDRLMALVRGVRD